MSYLNIDKSKLSLYKKTKKEVLSLIKPSKSQISEEQKVVNSIISKIKKMPGQHVNCVVAGSFARNTNLKDKKDFDIFVLYPPEIDEQTFLEEGLTIGKNVFKGYFWEKTFSQHPYIRGVIDGYDIEVIPAYNIHDTKFLQSAVDRTPFHSKYILENIEDSQKDEVRLLKYFLKKIDCYGADAKFQGFSGYLCELLILRYKDFITLLSEVSNWKPPVNLYLNDNDIKYLQNFNSPLVFIDPIDSNRNVASAVDETQVSKFIAGAREFLKEPSIDFFNKRIVKQITFHQLFSFIDNYPLTIITLDFKNYLEDIVWAKLRKISNNLETHLESIGYKLLRQNIYFDKDKELAYIFILTDTLNLSKYFYYEGPFVSDALNSEKFIENNKSIMGPFIKKDRWFVVKHRSRTKLYDNILDYLFRKIDVSIKVYVGSDIKTLYLKNTDIVNYFSDFLINKEKFLM